MKKYVVQSLPIAEVISNIAEGMNCNFEQHCSYYKLEIPSQYGNGSISGIQFTSGFALLNYDCMFYDTTRIEFTYNQVHPLKFIHCYAGRVDHYFEHSEDAHHIESLENIVVASKKEAGHILDFEKNIHVKLCSLEIDRINFNDKISCLLQTESGPIVKAISDKSAHKQFYRKGKYNLAVSGLIGDLTNIEKVSLNTILLKEGQSYLMLSYQWMEFHSEDNKSILEKFEHELFLKITNYIEDNISESLTIDLLRKEFAIGNKKIQKLFNTHVNKTVSKYIQDYRLEKALALLADPENNISEVVYNLGLKNRSYFTRTFKERYSLTPSQYIENVINS